MPDHLPPVHITQDINTRINIHWRKISYIIYVYVKTCLFYSIMVFVLLYYPYETTNLHLGALIMWVLHISLLLVFWNHHTPADAMFDSMEGYGPRDADESNIGFFEQYMDPAEFEIPEDWDGSISLEEYLQWPLNFRRGETPQPIGSNLSSLRSSGFQLPEPLADIGVVGPSGAEVSYQQRTLEPTDGVLNTPPPSPETSSSISDYVDLDEPFDSSIEVTPSNGEVTSVFQSLPLEVPRPPNPRYSTPGNLPSFYQETPIPEPFTRWVNPTYSTQRQRAHFYGYEHMYVLGTVSREPTVVNLEQFGLVPRKISYKEFEGLLEADFFFPVGVKLWTFEWPRLPRNRIIALQRAYPTYQITYTDSTSGAPTLSIASHRGSFLGMNVLRLMLFSDRYWNERSVEDDIRERLESTLPPINY